MEKKITLEVCCGSADDVIQAQQGGADRVELNSSLFHGGLTPSVGTLQAARAHASIPIIAMVRPRQGGFCYTPVEFEAALRDAHALLEAGADGLVFGFLHGDGTVDAQRTGHLARIARDAGKEAVFHRAIDVVPDWKEALQQLIDLGVQRVLTSGQAPDVFFALDTIREMVQFAGHRIQILPGAGVTLQNAHRIADYTGCDQLHIARHRPMRDTSTANNRDIFYGGALYPPEDRYDIIDSEYVGKVVDALK